MSTHSQDFCVGVCEKRLELDVEGDGTLDGIRTLPSVVVPEVRHDLQAPEEKTILVVTYQKKIYIIQKTTHFTYSVFVLINKNVLPDNLLKRRKLVKKSFKPLLPPETAILFFVTRPKLKDEKTIYI